MERSFEFDPMPPGWLARVYYTPVSDALRGRLSASLDIRPQIAAAGLPAQVSGLIYHVVRKTRLRRHEKQDVARELIAHFGDGLAAGHGEKQLIDEFGPPEQAARLIRKAKLRSRSWPWQVLRWSLRTFLALLALVALTYGFFALRLYWGRPTLAHNYWEEINAARKVEEGQRAWPRYRAVLPHLEKGNVDFVGIHVETPIDGPYWAQVVEHLKQMEPQLAEIRAAAALPELGFHLADPEDAAAARALHDKTWDLADDRISTEKNEMLIQAQVGQSMIMSRFTWLLVADARRAAAAGNGPLAVENLTALLQMSDQLFAPHSFIVEQLIGIAIFNQATGAINRILHESPRAFDEEQLRDLAHRLAANPRATQKPDFTSEREMFEDVLQRAYTDNGHGDGRLTAAGADMVRYVAGGAIDSTDSNTLDRLADPALAAIVASRREMSDFYNELLDLGIAGHEGPPWEWDERSNYPDDRLNSIGKSPAGKIRYHFVYLLFPATQAVHVAFERAIQQRDATQVMLALTLWHRRHGAWPERLEQLVPQMLPAVPPDRNDGQPLRYKLVDGRPLLYSVGPDGDDDGGRPPEEPDFVVARYGYRAQGVKFHPVPSEDGDWVLWPPPPAVAVEEKNVGQ